MLAEVPQELLFTYSKCFVCLILHEENFVCWPSAGPRDSNSKKCHGECSNSGVLWLCLQGPKIEGGHASARTLSFDGQSAAAAARSGVPTDLMTVAARVDAGKPTASIPLLGTRPTSCLCDLLLLQLSCHKFKEKMLPSARGSDGCGLLL